MRRGERPAPTRAGGRLARRAPLGAGLRAAAPRGGTPAARPLAARRLPDHRRPGRRRPAARRATWRGPCRRGWCWWAAPGRGVGRGWPPPGARCRRWRRAGWSGARCWWLRADVADEAQLRAVLAEADARFGALHGVIHAAGARGRRRGGAAQRAWTRPTCAPHFRPKVHGTHALERALARPRAGLRAAGVLQRRGARRPGLGRLRGRQRLPGRLRRGALARQGGTRWLSTNWDGWPVDAADGAKAVQTRIDQFAMSPAEAAEAFRRVLAAPLAGQVVVSTGNLDARVAQWVRARGRGPRRRTPAAAARAAHAGHRVRGPHRRGGARAGARLAGAAGPGAGRHPRQLLRPGRQLAAVAADRRPAEAGAGAGRARSPASSRPPPWPPWRAAGTGPARRRPPPSSRARAVGHSAESGAAAASRARARRSPLRRTSTWRRHRGQQAPSGVRRRRHRHHRHGRALSRRAGRGRALAQPARRRGVHPLLHRRGVPRGRRARGAAGGPALRAGRGRAAGAGVASTRPSSAYRRARRS